VNIGEFSRNGKSRDRETKKAVDHDMNPDLKSPTSGKAGGLDCEPLKAVIKP
jgi:hypothetical protein